MDNYVEFRWIKIRDLLLFNEDLENGVDPEIIISFNSAIQEVNSIIIVSPEYSSEIPGD